MKNKTYTIATLGSHSALLILKGAKDEGFNTLVITLTNRTSFYKRFPFIDKILTIPSFAKFPDLEKKINKKNIILIPHGSYVAYLGIEGNKKISIPYFGNKKTLDWESDREKQGEWMEKADLNPPKTFKNVNEIVYPVIVKSFGAAGGKGYFFAGNKQDFQRKIKAMEREKYIIQEYIIGVPLYIHYFYSPLSKQVEILGMDRRHETNVDGIGRLPLKYQKELDVEPNYVVVANSPYILRESLLPEAYAMAERVVATSKKLIDKRGLYGPFCLETIITPDQKFHVIEISCRIVAGTILFQQGSSYSWLIYNEPMSMGRRIAREIKLAIRKNKPEEILD
jgi:5-formaminoimidazole-4-carboxamide-1-(beta)-D-ribofuranosyl 5'-monophosphate synthetase